MNSLVLNAIERMAAKEPQRMALRDTASQVSYGQLADWVGVLAAKLKPYAGRCVAIDMPGGIEWVITDLACIAAQAPALPLPPFFSGQQREHALRHGGAQAVISPGFALTPLEHEPVPLPHKTAKITYTSGSTGEPKGVCLSQAGMEQVSVSLLAMLDADFAAHTAAVLPLGVLLENIAGCYTTLLAGGCYDVRPQETMDFIALARYLAESEATSCILVPELLRGLLWALKTSGIRLPALRFAAVGGARVSPALLQEAASLGLPVYQGYGLSESASVVAANTPQANHIDSVGTLLPHIRLHIASDGEIMLHDPALLGYVGEAPHSGLYPTGDLGHLDADGFLHITGRKKNLLITANGRNISPEWPESELLAQPEIAQCIVVGDAAISLSALLVPASSQLTADNIQAATRRANANLPAYAQIKQWRIVQPFTPDDGLLTANGRIKRGAILKAHRVLIESLCEEELYADIL